MNVQKIRADFAEANRTYPDLKLMERDGNLHITGSVPITLRRSPLDLPLDLAFLTAYPQNLPDVSISVPDQFPLKCSTVLDRTGHVNLANIPNIQRPSRPSGLVRLLKAICEYFSSNPPFDDACLPQLRRHVGKLRLVDSIQSRAISLIDRANRFAKTEDAQDFEESAAGVCLDCLNEIKAELQTQIDQAELALHDLENHPIQFTIYPKIEEEIRIRTSDKAYSDALVRLRNVFKEGKLSIREYIDGVKNLSTNHFVDDIQSQLAYFS
jgi:hypothetical protein